MENLVQECQIFGPTSVYCLYPDLRILTIEIFEHFQKRTSRSRYFILSANGTQMLSIPLCKGKNNHQLIRDVQVSYDEEWERKHLTAIKSAYGKSPYFDFYFPDIEKLFLKKCVFLFDLNMNSLQLMLKFLKINPEITFTKSFQNANFEKGNIQGVHKKEETVLVNYSQVWQEKFNFTPNLSILDLLFCTGPEAVSILKRMNSVG